MQRIHARAYAKVNLTLDVLGKRPDGYHEMDMIMQSVSLCDELVLTKYGIQESYSHAIRKAFPMMKAIWRIALQNFCLRQRENRPPEEVRFLLRKIFQSGNGRGRLQQPFLWDSTNCLNTISHVRNSVIWENNWVRMSRFAFAEAPCGFKDLENA